MSMHEDSVLYIYGACKQFELFLVFFGIPLSYIISMHFKFKDNYDRTIIFFVCKNENACNSYTISKLACVLTL